MTAKIGIYMITNTIDNKRYIGKSIDLKRRLRKHKYYLANETHHNIHLQRAYNKYGLEYFKFDILEYCTEKELDYLEMFYIEKYDSFAFCIVWTAARVLPLNLLSISVKGTYCPSSSRQISVTSSGL